jgi:membrane protease YdiL (CAAX protease family)
MHSANADSSRSANSNRELIIFYCIAIAISCAVSAVFWELPEGFQVGDVNAVRDAVNNVGVFYVLVPALTAVGVTIVFRGWAGLREIGGRLITFRFSPIYYLIALFVPLIPQWLGVPIWSLLSGQHVVYPPLGLSISHWAQVTLAGAVILLGEEIGWRGFMLPRLLQIFKWRSAALVGGLLWSFWHFPVWLPANYAATGSTAQTAIILAAGVCGATSISVIVTWLFVRTRYSIALAVLLHGSSNASMNIVYDTLGDAFGTNTLWALCSNALLVAVALVFLSLPDHSRRTSVEAA